MDYHQSFSELHPNLVKFAYLKDMYGVDTSNISGVEGGKEIKQGKVGVEVTAVTTYTTLFMVNRKLVRISTTLGEWVACITIFSWPLLKTINASIMTKNNALVSGLLGDQFKLKVVVPQRSKEAPKKLEVLPVSLPLTIPEKK